ncbi:MAG: ABC transporter ATP-binding protein [Desulfovibrio sp.]|nr:ABC transporter ATP-binding protein [Desulfovibrio sp.]
MRDLTVDFPVGAGRAPAVRGLSLAVDRARVTCLVGESGCGKSMTARAILRLPPERARLSGSLVFDGQDLLTLSEARMRSLRGRRMGMIFQEPMTALNPVLTVGDQAAEALRTHMGMSKKAAREEIERLFASVGISEPASRCDSYPHQLSGGMRQRVMIAMALSCGPDLLLADEPTTALDATIQKQILDLIIRESQRRGMAVLLISHDLGTVAQIADHVGVMYAGSLVESAPADELFAHPLHPYTQGLVAAVPGRDAWKQTRLPTIPGAVPALGAMPPGCSFAPRCPAADVHCREAVPALRESGGHAVACLKRGSV